MTHDGPLLSIVMPSLTQRYIRCEIVKQIEEQSRGMGGAVEFLVLADNGPMSTGKKMNLLYSMCGGKYICAVGDDDRVESDYVATLLDAVTNNDVDVVTFDHSYNKNGQFHALTNQVVGCAERQVTADTNLTANQIGYSEIHTRLPGPLCPVRFEIVKAFIAPDTSDKEDVAYKDYLKPILKTFHNIPRVLYHHLWTPINKTERRDLAVRWRRS